MVQFFEDFIEEKSHVCTDHKQVEELHLKNQLNRGYNKLQKKKKILQKN
jgi:hypothetical protein